MNRISKSSLLVKKFHLKKVATMSCAAVSISCLTHSKTAMAQTRSAGFTLKANAPFYQVAPQKALDLTDEVTLEAWVQADRMENGGGRIMDKGVPSTLEGYSLDTYPGNSLRFSTAGGEVSYDAKLPADQWTQVVGVYSASKRILKLYVNGREVASKTEGEFPPLKVSTSPLRIGSDVRGDNRFQGRIQRAAIYGRALSDAEVAKRFTRAAPVPGVLGEWVFKGRPEAQIKPISGTLALEQKSGIPAFVAVSPRALPLQKGKFKPTWESLEQYKTPDWFRDAKFGIWAHWGPQCEPEQGDWYARYMYDEGNWKYNSHVKVYGPPSKFGFKDVIQSWKAQNWDPDKLMALYKRAGAEYFFALGNHHDNFDLWDSKYQPWNSVNMGPKKDLIGGWAKAARNNGMKFGVSIHAAHAWTWYETAQRSDKNGPYAGIPYDGKLTKADGKGQWWEGYDPQDLYAQNHALSVGSDDLGRIHSQWNWGNGASIPDQAYVDKFYNRTLDVIRKYNPDLLYFDDTVLPLWPISDAGLKIAADFYNSNMKRHGGKLEAVLFGKVLDEDQRKALVWDIERGQSNKIEPYVWQTDTCIGTWHYERGFYDNNRYKSAKTVIQTLADVVSKNGNLLLSIPVRGDGTIDDKEQTVVEGIAEWMDINKESIFGTRPWKVAGEGPAFGSMKPSSAQGFNEGSGKPFTSEDMRFTKKGNTLYTIVLGRPTKALDIKSFGKAAGLLDKPIRDVQVLGSSEKLNWRQDEASLHIEAPKKQLSESAVVFKLSLEQ
jgi:alpha-L-fucosidase